MAASEARPTRVADLKQGQYSDGHPLDEVQYIECKLILNLTVSRRQRFSSSMESWSRRRQRSSGLILSIRVSFSSLGSEKCSSSIPPTSGFTIMPSSCARRIRYKDGFPAGDPGNRLQVP